MTVFLCILTTFALLASFDVRIRGTKSGLLLFGLHALFVVLTLGLATLALWSCVS